MTTRPKTDPSELRMSPAVPGSGIHRVAVLGVRLTPSFASVSDDDEPTVITRTPIAELHRRRLTEKLHAEQQAKVAARIEWLRIAAWCFVLAFVVAFAGQVLAGLVQVKP
jgi:hypothetical protein